MGHDRASEGTTMKRRDTLLPLLFGLVAAVGCGSDDSEGGLSGAEALQGIYTIGSFTRNEATCDAEGPDATSTLSGDTHLLGIVQSFVGQEVLSFYSCQGEQDCRDKQAKIESNGSFGFAYGAQLSEGSGTSFRGTTVSTGFSSAEGCVDGSVARLTAVLSGNALRIESRKTVADTYPPDSGGFCTTDLARKAAAGKPCSEIEVMTATRVSGL